MNCLCCGKPIKKPEEEKSGWHSACIHRFFGTKELPGLDVDESDLWALAEATVRQGLTVPGVQKKLSLHLTGGRDARLTLVDYPTGYILKPQTEDIAKLPEAEDMVMRMAETVGIPVVPHALIRMGQEGSYAYITKRIDRIFEKDGVTRLAMEDFCQLGGRLTEDKYRSSYENCARLITRFSQRAGLDLSELFLRLLFFFVTGNSDMHLKNFSLIETEPGTRAFVLSAAYDMLPVNLLLPEDQEQLALTLNGKKRRLRRNDFLRFAQGCGIPEAAARKMLRRVLDSREALIAQCRSSYLPEEMRQGMEALIRERMDALSISPGFGYNE